MEVIDISNIEESKKENLSLSDPSFLTDTDELIQFAQPSKPKE